MTTLTANKTTSYAIGQQIKNIHSFTSLFCEVRTSTFTGKGWTRTSEYRLGLNQDQVAKMIDWLSRRQIEATIATGNQTTGQVEITFNTIDQQTLSQIITRVREIAITTGEIDLNKKYFPCDIK